MNIQRLFTEHPASVGESYFEHLGRALYFSMRMIAGGFACLVHALLPFLCVKTGSDTICSLHDCMVVNRHRKASAGATSRAPAL